MSDCIELLEMIEDSFGITLLDAEVAKIVTVEDLCNCVIGKIDCEQFGGCPSANAFYQIRSILVHKLGLEKRIITPNADLNDLIIKEKRKEILKAIIDLSGLKLPQMGYTPFVNCLLFFAFLVLLSTPLLFLFSPPPLVFFADIMAVILLLLVVKTNVFDEIFPCNSMRDYINLVVALNYRKLSNGSSALQREDIIKVLKTMIAYISGLDINNIKLDDRLVTDLGFVD